MSKRLHIYAISRGYRKATVWVGDRTTGSRISVDECVPFRKLSRLARHAEICRWLYDSFKIPGPIYRDKEDAR